jgi:uncharacterized protein YoxC
MKVQVQQKDKLIEKLQSQLEKQQKET